MSQQEWRDGVGKIKPFLTANDIFSLEAPEPSPWRERSAHEIVQEKDFQGILNQRRAGVAREHKVSKLK